MKNFADRLIAKIDELKNPTVMGLDPLMEYLPDSIRDKYWKGSGSSQEATGLAITEFNCRLIDAVTGIIPAIKPQFAYYEMLGSEGVKALQATIAHAKNAGMLVIADAKRNDIGPTAAAYAKAILGTTEWIDRRPLPVFDADAVTVNGYLGIDGLAPFIKECEEAGKGLFILVRTSNPSAAEFQDLRLANGSLFYEAIAGKVYEWGRTTIGTCGYSSIGAVVGATWPQEAASLRKQMKDAIILVPGYGAQGGSAKAAAENFNADGKGAIVNASRSLMCAYKKENASPEEFEAAARREAVRMRDDLFSAIGEKCI